MTVAKFVQPDASTQTGTQYKANIDASIKALMELAANFAPHEADTPDMTVLIDAGKLWTGALYVSKAQQTTATFTAPTTNPRIDRIAIDITTGDYVVIAGTEAATPVAPSYKAGHYPVCQIALSVSQSSITNNNITDDRGLNGSPLSFMGCSAYNTSGMSLANSTLSNLALPSERIDTGAFHDTSTNNHRVYVPAGATRIRITGYVEFSNNSSGSRRVRLSKNTGVSYPNNNVMQHTGNTSETTVVPIPEFILTAASDFTAGTDYYSLEVYQDSGTSLTLTGQLNMQVLG